ncbi:MAG: 3-deoxy-D-manno-octulosonic acid kinase, partial [Succinivibrio sp.]
MIKEITKGRTKYLINDKFFNELTSKQVEEIFDREAIMKNQQDLSFKKGRGKTLMFSKNSISLVLRHYRRGGLTGKLLGDIFLFFEKLKHRAFDEFNMLIRMQEIGLKVPEAVAAKEINFGLYLRQDIVIKRLDGFEDLSSVIDRRPLTKEEFESIGNTIRSFFEKDIMHTDLNIRNILINDQREVYLIDFDKCFFKKLKE